MKKSKFLLLGSVASLASIPFIAAKCGETKEEEKKNLKLTKNQSLSENIRKYRLLAKKFRKSTSCWTR
nr:variable surface lipoprotein [Mycoplasmopsis bovis]